MAELADAYGSGPYGGNPMEVQVLSPAPFKIERPASAGLFASWIGALQFALPKLAFSCCKRVQDEFEIPSCAERVNDVTYFLALLRCQFAGVAELADAYGSGPYGGNPMEVQVLSPAPSKSKDPLRRVFLRMRTIAAPCHSFRKPTYFGVKRCASFLLTQRCCLRACLACYYSAETLIPWR